MTGAGGRLGQAMAIYLAGRGYDVAVHYASSQAGAEETRAAIEAQGKNAVARLADLLVEEDTQDPGPCRAGPRNRERR